MKDNYSEIHYRVYEAVLDQHTGKASGQSPGLTPSPSARGQSPASVNAIDIATLGLRTAGCLVSADSSRRVLWAFSNSSRFDVLARAVSAVIDVDDEKIVIHGVTLQRILSGHISSQELTRPDPSFDTPKISTDRSGTRNSNSGIASADFNRTLNAKAVFQNGNQTTTSTPETQFSESHHQSPSEEGAYDQVIHKNLIDAIASSISLRLCQQKRFIPLNARDLILVNPAVRDTPDDEKSDVRGYGSCKPSLLSLEVRLHRSGSLLLSYSLSSQPWLGILPTTMRSEANPASSQRNLNLWLAPSGCVARLLTAETAVGSTPGSKQVSPIKMHGFESQKDSENRLRIWKSRTLRWLETHGLNTTTMLDDIWIEVEIPVPGPLHSGTSKIFWPSSLCIFREISRPEDLQTELLIWFSPTNGYGDFLGFAEEWLASAGSRQEKLNKRAAEKAAQKATDARHERVQRNHDHTDSLEGFARTPNYLELPPGNTIYPTPPDGIHPQRLQPVSFADGAAETPAEAEEPPINKSDNPMGSVNGDTSMDMLDDSNILMSRNNSTMATGLYDASDNEDLFGEMDGDHFEAKALTEADFSFFDEPSLENLDSNDIDMEDDDQVAGHGSVVGKDTNQDADNVQTSSGQLSAAVDANTKADGSIAIKDHTVGDVTLEHPSEETMAAPADPASTEPTVDAHKPVKLPVSPPLSPFEVRKKMFSQNMPPPWSGGRKEFDPKRKQSVFEAVDFGESLDLSDKKYAEDGRFSVPNGTIPPTEASRERTPLVSTTIPTIGRLKRKKNGPLNLKIEPTPSTPAVPDQAAGVDRFNFADVLQAVSNEEKESDSSPTDSEQGPAQKLLQGTKRKRRTSDAVADPPSARPDVSTSPADADLADLEEDMETLYYLSPSVAEGSFDGYFSMRDNPNLGVLPVSSESFPQLSQVLLEQFSQTTLKHRLDGAIENLALDERGILQDYSEAIQYAFAEASHCDFPTYVKLGDGVSIKREEYSNAGVTDDKLEGLKADVVKLPPQPVRLRRAKNSMEILPSVLPFWETFGLGPHGGPKDVVGLCIHPPTVNAREGANTFLDRLSDAYHSCNLGTHTRTDVSEDHKKSLIPWTLDEPMDVSLAAVMEALKTTCETLGMLSKYPVPVLTDLPSKVPPWPRNHPRT
jgi:mediator of RNA polymerase II transcription subunit 13, fungi type